MQDFLRLSDLDRTQVINSMATSAIYTLKDNRDNKSYQIAKLKTGDVWMVDNLDLGRTSLSTNLTSTNTNLQSNLSLSVSATTFNSWKKTSGSTSIGSGEFINVTGSEAGGLYAGIAYGTLYNYYAASAGTVGSQNLGSDSAVIVQSDICPAGWRLPLYNEYANLYTSYDSYYPNMRKSVASGGAGFALAGWFNGGTPTGQGNGGGYYWLGYGADVYSAALQIDTSTYTGFSWWGRQNGFSIRCVVKQYKNR